MPLLNRRALLQATAASLALPAFAQAKTIKFLNDWRWEGPAAGLLVANKGLFQKERLEVVPTPGTGSGATVAKVASGEFDLGLGDFASLIEHAAKNPTLPPPVAVYVLYERMPATLFLRNDVGNKVADLAGKKIGAPGFDAGRKLWPLFASLAKAPAVTWVDLKPELREKAFATGEVDAITGFHFTSTLNLEREGFSGSRYNSIPFHEMGVRLYGNVLLVNAKFLEANGNAVKGFVRAYNAGVKDAMVQTRQAMKFVKELSPQADEQLEWRRARLAFDNFVNTPTVAEEGLGTVDMRRVADQIAAVAQTLKLIALPNASSLASADYLPPLADRRTKT